MRLMREIAAIMAAGMLGGCAVSGLVGASAPATFDLEAPQVERMHARGIQVTVYPPVAVKTIDTVEILVKGGNGRVAYFSGAAWGDRLPALFQARLVQTLANSGAFRAVLTNQDRVTGDLSLAIEIRDFQVDATSGSAEAVVDVYVKLVDERTSSVVTTKRFHASVAAASTDPNAGIHALNTAFQQVAAEITTWVARRG